MKDDSARFTVAAVLCGAIFCLSAWGLYEFVYLKLGNY